MALRGGRSFLAGLGLSLALFRVSDRRIARLKDFSGRIAEGDFRPLPAESSRDGLAGLAAAMNETAARLERTIGSLSGERNRSSAILRSMVEGVAVIDAHERLVFSNRAFSEILNLDPANIEGRPADRGGPQLGASGTDSPRAPRRGRPAKRHRHGHRSAAELRGHSHSRTSARIGPASPPGRAPRERLRRRKAAREKPSGAVVVLHDVTELRRLERVRQDFVANVSHEFKTPLTAIQGFAETLLGRRSRRSPQQPALPRNYPRACRPARSLDGRPAETRAHRSGEARGGVSLRPADGAD